MSTPRVKRLLAVIAAAGILIGTCSGVAAAGDAAAQPPPETVGYADLVVHQNPAGLMLMVGGHRRWSGPPDPAYGIPAEHRQVGWALGINPAYARASLHGEWKPVIFAQVRLQYDAYRFFGRNGALLSFPSADSKFGKAEVDDRSGEEQTGWAHRAMLQPVLTGKVGGLIVRNTTDLAYYRFSGEGPYFLESEYDTLLKDGDFLVNNRTSLLVELWTGSGGRALIAGPYFDLTHAAAADLTRERVGLQFYCSPLESLRFFQHPRLYGRTGVNLRDRNREGEMFVEAGIGADF
ncbi:MAG: hypothetical protein HZB55_07585 [Deltaproteobacteria bacterium]|nr:hypothetical protein [Deltaproteobacteria bacterium]